MLENQSHNTKQLKKSKGHTDHPCHSESLPRLKRAQGQLEGIVNMIDDGRYCPDIIIQIRAVTSALKAIEGQIIERHLRGCIQNAIKSKNAQDIDQKITALTNLYMKGL